MKIISSYPRSGQAKLRFLICNILYPEIEHDFETIRKFTPSIDNAEQLNNCADNVKFLFTHSNIRADVYLYRNVCDVLVSEYWYKKKNYPDFDQDINSWIITQEYGKEWRQSVEAGRGATKKISFEQLNNISYLSQVIGFTTDKIKSALDKCSFENMAEIEKRNQNLIGGDPSIPYMRSGKNFQMLGHKLYYDTIRMNEGELEYLGYWSHSDWEGFNKTW